jgi:CMP-N,N'-diacetyllegionaminic acid synthase
MMLGVIPARKGSKGIIRKNLHPLGDKRLIDYTIEAAERSDLDDYVISTDIDELFGYTHVIPRPGELALDDTPTLPVIQHAVAEYERERNQRVKAVMILQPTSPLRTAGDINGAITMYRNSPNNDSLVSVVEGVHPMKSYNEQGRQFYDTRSPFDRHRYTCLTRNGAIFITSRPLLDKGLLYSAMPKLFKMSKLHSIDIDDWDDLKIAEALLRARRD